MKKLIKSGISLALAILFCFCIAGCEEESTPSSDYVEFDVKTFEDDILNNVKFDAEMDGLSDAIVLAYYPDLPRTEDGVYLVDYDFWTPTQGGSADIFVLLKSKNEEDVEKSIEWAENQKEQLKTANENYDAEEIAKIDNAVIRKNGKFVALIITDDYKTAQSIVDKYWTNK